MSTHHNGLLELVCDKYHISANDDIGAGDTDASRALVYFDYRTATLKMIKIQNLFTIREHQPEDYSSTRRDLLLSIK